ncbi:MAG: efflux RND transporter periplasmic adaptor subunit, partial [Marinobacter sp.]|uniref:efflux RND transporter periplasmic adaptor subunit n=1 Tax=Marinobacter sp. TaxID=50741 RepID=UPI00299D8458
MTRLTARNWGPVVLAVVLVVALVLWMLSGDVKRAEQQAPEAVASEQEAPPLVAVEVLESQIYQPTLSIQGQLQPWRMVTVLARADGTVESLPLAQGSPVDEGEPLLRISPDERPGRMLQAEARVRQLEAEMAAIERLRSDNLASRTDKLRLESELAAARADLAEARLIASHLAPAAPFEGIINRRLVELGEYIRPGDPLMELVQVDRLKVTGSAPQQTVA